MPYLIDIYALAPARSTVAVERFLDRFVPSRNRAEADYWVTLEGLNPAAVFDTPEESVLELEDTHVSVRGMPESIPRTAEID